MKLSPISRALRAAGFTAQTLGLAIPLTAVLSHNAWADPSAVSAGDASATSTNSAATTMSFPVTRSGDASYASVVQFTTQDGSAAAPGDYTAKSGSATIPAGATSASINVSIPGHGAQADKQFSLQLLGAAGIGPTPNFAAQQAFAMGAGPYALATADLNGDGKLDLAVIDGASDTVSVRLNTTAPGATTPSYAAPQTFTIGLLPQSLTSDDLNGDGKPDLVVGTYDNNTGSNSVRVLLNTTTTGAATPTFAPQKPFATGNRPSSVTTADLNGDGKPDLVVANYNENTVSVLRNTTAPGATLPSFATQATFATGNEPSCVNGADVSGDGKPDLIVANYFSNTVSVLLNTTAPGAATPTFATQAAFAAGSRPTSVTSADLNGDGKPDLAVSNFGTNTVSVLLSTTAPGATTPSYAAPQPFATGTFPLSVASADLNGDGKPDLAVANYNSDTVSVLLNTTAAGATTASYGARQTFATETNPRSVTTADLNGDGKPDLAVANYSSNSVSVLLNATPAPATTFGSGSLAAQQTFAAGNDPRSVTTADFNGDGKPDLAIANTASTLVSVQLNTTSTGTTLPSYAAPESFSASGGPHSIIAADLNGDGKADLAFTSLYISRVSVLLNTTAPGDSVPSYIAQQVFDTGDHPRSVTAADFNGDGKPDLAVANLYSGSVSVLLNTTGAGVTTASYAAQETFATGASPVSVTNADLNGDGKPDLAVANFADGTASVLINTTAPGASTPSYTAQETFATGQYPASVTAADFNGDGKPDLAFCNAISNTVSVLVNTTGAGATVPSYAALQTFASGTKPLSVSTADLNGDGKPDLVVANYYSASVSVLLNTTTTGAATLSYAAQQTFATGSTPRAVTTTDFNGDGRPDLAVANVGPDTVSVLLNTQYQSTASTTPAIGTVHFTSVPVDLSLTQSANTNPVHINTSGGLTYTATAHNNSATFNATALVLTETLASGLSYNTFSSGDAWSCSAIAQVVTCNLASLVFGASSSVDITADVGAAAGSIKTTGTVSSNETDPAPANNNKNVTTTLCDPAATNSIGFGSTSFPATEGVPVVIAVNRSGTSCSNTTVHYATTSGGSAPAADFTATSGDFTWLPLDANKKTFTVNLANDSVFSGNRTVNLALTSPSANATLTKSTSSITIKDDEVPVTIGLSTSDQSVSEEGGVATVTATLSVARAVDTTVPLIVTGTATRVKDYVLSAPSIVIPAGQFSAGVTLTGVSDLLDEQNETAIVKMSAVSGVTISGTTTNTITFNDDDATPTVSFDTAASSKNEFKANAVNLVLSAPSGQDVTVNVSSTGGTAANGTDYTINGSGTVTILAGATSATAVRIVDDAVHESSETAVFQIDSATNATPSGIQATTLTITDNDP